MSNTWMCRMRNNCRRCCHKIFIKTIDSYVSCEFDRLSGRSPYQVPGTINRYLQSARYKCFGLRRNHGMTRNYKTAHDSYIEHQGTSSSFRLVATSAARVDPVGAAAVPATDESMNGDSSSINLLATKRPTRSMCSSQNFAIFGADTEESSPPPCPRRSSSTPSI